MKKTLLTLGIAAFALLNLPIFMGSCSSCNDGEATDSIEAEEVALPTTHLDTIIGQRMDSLMHSRMRIDTEKASVSIYSLRTNTMVYEHKSKQLRVPASCMKLLTAITALDTMGCDYVFKEELHYSGKIKGDTLDGSLVFIGDDDPLFLDFENISRAARDKGIRHVTGSLMLELARTDTLKAHPTAAAWDIPYGKLPILLKGEKLIRQSLTYSLRSKGVTISDNTLPLSGESELIAEEQHTLVEILSEMLIHSSNIKADAMFYHLEKVLGNRQNDGIDVYSHKRLHRTEQFVENKLGLPIKQNNYVINDGSGLSPKSRLTTDFFINLLRYAYHKKAIFNILIDQALATPQNPERLGSLKTRMSTPMFKERIFAKTGTIVTIGASSLSGFAKASDGNWYAFSIINEDSPVEESHIFQDNICKELVK